ncbi:MAG: hypothetical protein GY702_02070 [Desulfobulbaceae bacterium]|nr:hypothetical protein [Desulfobulbaceae bacterium]
MVLWRKEKSYTRHGLLPHPIQIAEGERVRQRIIKALTKATDVVFSHFHGDHILLWKANLYQLAIVAGGFSYREVNPCPCCLLCFMAKHIETQ